jgi:hypothetical protein
LLGNMAFESVSSQPVGVADFELFVRRGFGVCRKDLTGALTLLGSHVCCLQVLTCPRLTWFRIDRWPH